MVIYGTALLSLCLVCGILIGKLIGLAIGIDANVGGVGIAMLLLIAVCGWLQRFGRMQPPTKQGILFWSSIYIPIVVAMAASQNVLAAVRGGPVALVAGTLVVVLSFAMVPLLSKIGPEDDQSSDSTSPVEGLKDWSRDQVSHYKIPKQVLFVDQLPRNAMGKVTKPAVRELFE